MTGAARTLFGAGGALALFAGALGARFVLEATGAANAAAATAFALRQPLPTVTGWPASPGVALLALWCAALAIATTVYVRTLFAKREPARLAGAIAAAALGLASAAWPVVFSSDALAYAAYGREALLGISPYGTRPLEPGDPVFAAVVAQWGNPPPICAYGPAFVAFAAGAALVAGRNPFVLVVLIRCAAIGAFIAATHLMGRLAGPRGAFALGANPLLAWAAAEGHNDALAFAWVLLGLVALSRTPAAAAFIALGGLVKAPALLAILGSIRADVASSRGVRRGWAALGLAAAAAASAPMLLAFLAHRNDPHVGGAAAFGLPAAAGSIGGPIAEASAIFAILGAGIALAARRLTTGRRSGYVVLGLTLWYALPNVYPWYGIWLVALVPLAESERLRAVVVGATIAAAVRYLPDALATPPPAALVTTILALPLVALVALRPRPHPECP